MTRTDAGPAPGRPAPQGPTRIGVVGLTPRDRAVVARAVASGGARPELVDAADLDALRQLVTHRRIDVAVCGHRAPATNARLALDAVRRITTAIPVVVLARGGDEDTAVALMTAGASDYVPMPCRDAEVQRALVEAASMPPHAPRTSPTARFAHLLDQLDIGTFRILPDHTIVEANDATRRIMRLPSMAALLSRQVAITGAELERRAQWTRRLEADGLVRRWKTRVTCADGTPIILEGDARAVHDERGRFVGAEGHLRDVTDREQATERLEFQALLLAHVRHVVVATGPDFKVAYWNRCAEELLQRPSAAVIDGDVARALGVEDPDRIKRIVDAALLADGEWEGVLEAHRPDGHAVVLHARGSRLEAGGKHVGYLGTMIDITEHRRLERELEAALAVRDRLLRDVHHRVRRNLQMVSRLLRLQQARTDDAGLQALFRDSERRLRAIALIHDWLSPASGTSLVNVRDYLTHLVEGVHATSETLGSAALSTAIDPLSLDLDTAVRIGLIVNELVTNALKHAFVGGRPGTVSVSLRCADSGMALTVADDGAGLPSDLDMASTATLGLPLVRNLAAGLGGAVQIERDGGTRVRIVFPPPCADRAP